MNVAVKKVTQYAALVTDRSVFVSELELVRILRDSEQMIANRNTPRDEVLVLYIVCGTCCTRRGRHEKALEYYKKALGIEPRNAMTLISYGVGLMHLGDVAGAVRAWGEAAVVTGGTQMVALANLAEALMASGCADDAWEAMREAIRLADMSSRYETFVLAQQCAEIGADEQAVEFFARHVSIRNGIGLDVDAAGFLREVPRSAVEEAIADASPALRTAVLRALTLDLVDLPPAARRATVGDSETHEEVLAGMRIYRQRANAAVLDDPDDVNAEA